MSDNTLHQLNSISPVDGRYRKNVEELANYTSELALIRYRTQIEIKYFIALSKIGVIRKLKNSEIKILQNLYDNYSLKDIMEVKKIEETTRHDVKAVEYSIKQKLNNTSLSDILEFFHFGLTSEDINNLTIRLMLKDGLQQVIISQLAGLENQISSMAKKYKNLPMLARTHGQAAVPTTLGKEFLVFYERFDREVKILKFTKLYGKLNGAVGNYNALSFSYPEINWTQFSKEFISSLSLEINSATNQIAPFEDIIFVFQTLQRINGILLDFDQDMWRYISDGWFIQENKAGEVGSSTMPQKINPILFENSEGNAVVANGLISAFTDKLPISRLQRDLSNSTISRNFGMTLAYCLLAYKNCISALSRVSANEEKIREDLNSDWSILSEAVQIFLKKDGIKDGYEIIKEYTRGHKMTKDDFIEMISRLPISEEDKEKLATLSPENYIGII